MRTRRFGCASECLLKFLILLAIAGSPAMANSVESQTGKAGPPGVEALDWAFKFASAIESDPADRGKAQHAVVADFSTLDAFQSPALLQRAVRLADRMEGWRQGVAYADLASAFIEQGKPEQARSLIVKARSVRSRTDGWQGPRIDAHVAQALGLLGEVEESTRVAEAVAQGDPRQYMGRAAASVATGYASRGDFETALKGLSDFDDRTDYDVAWWRTHGYLSLAELEFLLPQERERALVAARKSAEGIKGWMRIEALHRVAKRLTETGRKREARETLQQTEKNVRDVPSNLPMKGPLLSRQARAWADFGETERARTLMTEAEQHTANAMEIELPGIYADFGASRMAIGDTDKGREFYDLAIASAESLQNARPRALAVVAICRSLAREDLAPDDGIRARLDALYRGLKAPW